MKKNFKVEIKYKIYKKIKYKNYNLYLLDKNLSDLNIIKNNMIII